MLCELCCRYWSSDALVVQLQDALDDRDLRMATHVLHAMTPDNLAVLEQELAANLEQVTALELGGTLCFGHGGPLFELPLVERNVLHVFWSLGSGQVQGEGHAQSLVEFARRVGEDGEGAASGLLVEGDHGW